MNQSNASVSQCVLLWTLPLHWPIVAPEMETKLAHLIALMMDGRMDDALKLAGKFPRLGDEKVAITRGREALIRPEFFLAIRKDPKVLVADGHAALLRRYPLCRTKSRKTNEHEA